MKAMAAVTAFVAGEAMNVSQVCRDCGISRKTFYKYVRRCREEGAAGFVPRSRHPQRFPNAVSDDVEDAVVRLRKELADAGHDHGATTIVWHLGRDDRFARRVPAVATVHRILVRRGFVIPQPDKRPKTSWRRFEAPAPNALWQIDAMDWTVGTGVVKVFNIIDDHSRVACRSRAVGDMSSEQAWSTFCEAGHHWGLPSQMLSDNGLCFSGKLRGFEVVFESNLRDAGILPITGKPYHPQTTGKVERFQQTLKRWLRNQDRRWGIARDITELQTRLDEFTSYYNTQRPHQGIGRVTPITRWTATAPATPGEPIAHPTARPATHPEAQPVTITNEGIVRIKHFKIAVGVEWANHAATVLLDHHHATIFSADHHLIRHLKLDHTRTYQPTGRRPGGPRRPRHLTS